MDRASQGQTAEPDAPDHHCDTVGGGKGGGKGICFNSRLFFCLIYVAFDLVLYSDGVGGVHPGLCSHYGRLRCGYGIAERCLLVLSQKAPLELNSGNGTPGEDRPICGSYWPLCGLRYLGMFMPLLKLSRKGVAVLCGALLESQVKSSATSTCLSWPAPDRNWRPHPINSSIQLLLKVKSRCRPLFLVPYVCRSLSLFLLFLLLGLVASVLRHSFDTPYNRYFHPHPTPLATKATATSSPGLMLNLSQFIDFEISFFKDMA